jgi:hypothetical protein
MTMLAVAIRHPGPLFGGAIGPCGMWGHVYTNTEIQPAVLCLYCSLGVATLNMLVRTMHVACSTFYVLCLLCFMFNVLCFLFLNINVNRAVT